MANKGNPSRQPVWLVLFALCLFASCAIDLTSLVEMDALEAETQSRLELSDRQDENEPDDIRLADADHYRLSAGSQLPGNGVKYAPLAISDAYPPDTVHGPPLPHSMTA